MRLHAVSLVQSPDARDADVLLKLETPAETPYYLTLDEKEGAADLYGDPGNVGDMQW